MKLNDFNEAVGMVDDDLIAEAIVAKRRKGAVVFKRAAAIAACFIVLCAGSIGFLNAKGFDFHSIIREFFHKTKIVQNDQTIAATVNREPIYQSSISVWREYIELSYQTGVSQVESLDIPEEQKQTYLEKLEDNRNQTDEEILNALIENKVLSQEAERQGITVSEEEEAYHLAETAYETLKDAANKADATETDKNNYLFITEYRQSMQMTEEEYLKRAADGYKEALIRAKLLNNFSKALPEQANESDTKGEEENYIEELMKNANIKRF